MGSSSSRLGSSRPSSSFSSPSSSSSRPSRVNRSRSSRRSSFSSFICGGSDSTLPIEMEDHSELVLVNSSAHCDPELGESGCPVKDSFILSCTETGFTNTITESGSSSVSRVSGGEDTCFEDRSRHAETSSRRNYLSESNNIAHPYQVNAAYNPHGSYREISSARANYAAREGVTSGTAAISGHTGVANNIDKSFDSGASQISLERTHRSSTSPQNLETQRSEWVSAANHVHSSNSGSLLTVSNTTSNVDSVGGESLPVSTPSGPGLLLSGRELGQRDESLHHRDMVSNPSNISSSGDNADIINREARRNSRRLFWDAFSRRNSRRHSNSPSIVLSNDDTDGLGSHGRWLLDFSGEFLYDGAGSDSGHLGSRIHSLNERRRHSRSEIWERLRTGMDDNGRQMTFCASGVHPDGTCSCDSLLMTEESSTRASISRIVMLAEALFEVLDEIHRQPLSLSLSTVSLPASGSVVDSFPLKNYKKHEIADPEEDVQQCYICLDEYEEEDKIRVLPCNHEFHMSCVDKWLKEIHGVCPLCRGDVSKGVSDCTVVSNTNTESFSL